MLVGPSVVEELELLRTEMEAARRGADRDAKRAPREEAQNTQDITRFSKRQKETLSRKSRGNSPAKLRSEELGKKFAAASEAPRRRARPSASAALRIFSQSWGSNCSHSKCSHFPISGACQ